MYYLVIKNLGVERCVDKSRQDYYKNTRIVDCRKSVGFKQGIFVRNIMVRCIESPDTLVEAAVYKDES